MASYFKIICSNDVNDIIKLDKLKSIDISISHCKEYAVATVIAVVED